MSLERLSRAPVYLAAGLAAFSAREALGGPWGLGALGAAGALGWWREERGWRAPSGAVLAALGVLGAALILSRASLHDPVVPGIRVLVLLTALKLLGEKRPRDCLQVYLLSLLTLAASTLLWVEAGFALLALAFMVVAEVGLVLLHARSQLPQGLPAGGLRRLMGVSLAIPIAGLPLLALFFLVLPRSPVALWRVPGLGGAEARTGLGEELRLGAAERIVEDGAVAFRARLSPRPPGPLYWRGIAYDRYRAGRWIAMRRPALQPPRFPPGSPVVRQTIWLEPREDGWLPALDRPARVLLRRGRAVRVSGGTFRLPGPRSGRLSYEAVSLLAPSLAGPEEPDRCLEVPPEVRRWLAPLAERALGPGHPSPPEAVRRLRGFFRRHGFVYVRRGLRPAGADPLWDFLLRSRRGCCEHFATAAALLLRCKGIPTRVVAGYRGGQWNELGGYYMVSQRMAHAWAEAYWRGHGWLRIEVTPGAGRARGYPLWSRALDWLRFCWYEHVLRYDFLRQALLLQGLEGRLRGLPRGRWWRRWRAPRGGLLPAAAGVPLTALAIAALRRRRRDLAERLRRELARRGFRQGRAEGMLEFARRVGARSAGLGALVEEFARGWYEMRYGGAEAAQVRRRLRETLRRIRRWRESACGRGRPGVQ